MKLLIVTPYFYPKAGGLETYAYNLCKTLQKDYKIDIVVITANHQDKKYRVETLLGIKIYRLPWLFKISNTPLHPLWYWKIKKILKEEKPDIINAHTPVPGIADITALAAGNIPFILTYHAFSLYKYNAPLFNVVIKAYKKLEKYLFAKAAKIVLVAEAITQSIPDIYKKKIVVINNTLPLREIPKLRKQTVTKQTQIVFIGSLDKTHEWKGLQDILLALKLYLSKTKSAIMLNIIGDGDNKPYYQNMTQSYGLEKHVTFFGKKEDKEKNAIIQKATLGIIYPKSLNDAFPTVALEYWAQSVAIIAADSMPINKIIKHKKTGYLVAANNPKALSEAIEIVLNNKILRDTIVLQGYTEMKKKYVSEDSVKKFYKVATSLL